MHGAQGGGDISQRVTWWECLCECGKRKTIRGNRLTAGETISCGCVRGGPTLRVRSATVRQTSAAQCHTRRARKQKAGGTFTADQIRELFARQKGKCANCRCKITMETMHRDHKIPVALGGPNDIRNIQLLCIPCNRRKYAKDPIDFARENGRLL